MLTITLLLINFISPIAKLLNQLKTVLKQKQS